MSPARYTIFPDERLSVTVYSGELAPGDIVECARRVYADPRFETGFRELIVDADADYGALDGHEVRWLQGLVSENARQRGARFRTAFAAAHDLPFGFGRMYEAIAEGSPETMAVFRSVDEALEWLGVDPGAIEL